ncbi:uncharacterized protein LOC126622849 [Malus sylvestris]|uniref:uncharacterized protein LOC126622849 n=1 Tax=Malus sylvestris TaxID=3752 RepID=UPI0021ABCA07|nr:uncharacterized protein LOC126622849 [Malus sylvestris]
MLFFMTTLNLAHVVKEEAHVAIKLSANKDMLSVIYAWTHFEFLCKNYISNGLDDCLYDVYSSCKIAKDFWDSLTKKYITEDAGSKKFLIGKFLKFNIVDSKPVIGQVEELQRLIHDLHAEGCLINELFQVGAIIEKLPSSWNDFKIYMKHKRREMSLEYLILTLRVEEDHRKGDKVDAYSMEAKANFIEVSNPRPKHFQKKQGEEC